MGRSDSFLWNAEMNQGSCSCNSHRLFPCQKYRSCWRSSAQRFPWELCQSCMCEEWDEARDGASNGSSHPTHSRLHRSRHLTKNPQSRCTDSRTMCTEVPGLCRLPDQQNGKNAPSLEIFLQKEWFSQILCLPLPCHWWFLLVLKCCTKVSEKSDMAKSWATFCCSGTYKKVKLKCCGI